MKIKTGDVVHVNYTGKLKDGSVFDSSDKHGKPLQFEIGGNHVIPGFEEGLIDMAKGESKVIDIKAENAYGTLDDTLIFEVAKEKVPTDMDPQVGQMFNIPQPNGHNVPVIVKDVTDDFIVIDANHPLAGQDLTFEVEVVEVQAR